jgi:hypothetical protein
MLLQAADHLSEQRGEPLVVLFQVCDPRFKRLCTVAAFRDLALLIQIPEQAHSSS